MNKDKYKRISIGSERAIEFAKTGWWKKCTAKEIVNTQLWVKEMMMDLAPFQAAMEEVLGRPVQLLEFMDITALMKEYLGEKEAPSLKDILSLIPDNKVICIHVG